MHKPRSCCTFRSAFCLMSEPITSFFAFLHMLKSADVSNTFSRRTLIETRRCMTCDRLCNHIKSYNQDEYPSRHVLCCERAKCVFSSLNRFIVDANAEECYPFVMWANKLLWIARSDGNFSVGKVIRNSPLFRKSGHSDLFVLVIFERTSVCTKTEEWKHASSPNSFELIKAVPVSWLCTSYQSLDIFTELFDVKPLPSTKD
jgi:hypothetical protein